MRAQLMNMDESHTTHNPPLEAVLKDRCCVRGSSKQLVDDLLTLVGVFREWLRRQVPAGIKEDTFNRCQTH